MTNRQNHVLCSLCADFGYWKPTYDGIQPVCRYGENFNFKEMCYDDGYAAGCKSFRFNAQAGREDNLTAAPRTAAETDCIQTETEIGIGGV